MRGIVAWDVVGDRSEWFRHRSGRRPGVVRRCGGQRTTVWRCEPAFGGWIPDVVVRAVTTYSVPGDRVLLVSDERGGLHDAAWSVIRLGRGVRTRMFGQREGSGTQPGPNGAQVDQVKVVLVSVDPESVGLVRPTRLGSILAPRGVLVVVTYAVWSERRLCDPGGSLMRAAAEDGLRFVDRVALLQDPESGAVRVQGYADAYVFGRCDVG